MKYVPLNQIFQQLEDIKKQITVNNVELIDVEEAAKHLKLKKSYIYLLIHKNEVPFYKPNGKKIYFNRLELNEWILKSKRKTKNEIEEEYKSNGTLPFEMTIKNREKL